MAEGVTRWDRELLDALVAEGWLRSQRHPEADLWIYNYTAQTQYASHWTPETLACRGLIIDADGAVVARPFGKFFNLGDPQIGEIPVEPLTVTEKIDGSLGIVYQLGGEQFVASRGAFASEQAKVGTAMLRDQALDVPPGVTVLFEIVYPENRIVVDYGERRELVLLAATRHADALDAPLPAYTGPVVPRHEGAEDLAALAAMNRPNAEGFVVSFESGLRVKVKFEDYVRLHRIVTGINARSIWEALREGQDVAALLDGVPDEIYAWITSTAADIGCSFAAVESACETVFAGRPADADRKTTAQYFLASGADASVLFRMLDGKSYEDLIWKAVKPEPMVPESVARFTDA